MTRHKLPIPCKEALSILGPPLFITSYEVDKLALVNKALALEVKKSVNTGLLKARQDCVNLRCVGDYEVECDEALIYTVDIKDVNNELLGKELLIKALKALGIDYMKRI